MLKCFSCLPYTILHASFHVSGINAHQSFVAADETSQHQKWPRHHSADVRIQDVWQHWLGEAACIVE